MGISMGERNRSTDAHEAASVHCTTEASVDRDRDRDRDRHRHRHRDRENKAKTNR
jgi:hypothetical protein